MSQDLFKTVLWTATKIDQEIIIFRKFIFRITVVSLHFIQSNWMIKSVIALLNFKWIKLGVNNLASVRKLFRILKFISWKCLAGRNRKGTHVSQLLPSLKRTSLKPRRITIIFYLSLEISKLHHSIYILQHNFKHQKMHCFVRQLIQLSWIFTGLKKVEYELYINYII